MNNTNDKIIELASNLVNIIKKLNAEQYNLSAGVYLAELSSLLETRKI